LLTAETMTLLLAFVKNPQPSLTHQRLSGSLLSAINSTFVLQEVSVIFKRWKNPLHVCTVHQVPFSTVYRTPAQQFGMLP
jgi:hypothetical protein